MAGGNKHEFVVREHWKSELEEERRENLTKILALWRSLSREGAGERGE